MYAGRMVRALLSWALGFSVTACAPAKDAGASLDGASASSPPAATSKPGAEVAPTASSATAEPSPVEVPPLELPKGALFVYREGDVTVAFTAPRRVTRLGAHEPCSHELGERGNMYSGSEIEAAWRNADVTRAETASSAFMPPEDLPLGAEVRGATGTITWTPFCGGLCVQGPPGVVSLLRVLHVLATNARGVCASAR